MIVLIPACRPGLELPRLVADLRATDPGLRILVVDDGSGPAFTEVFAATRRAGAEVLGHPVNRGKGYALRAGLAHAARRHPGHGVVCADADGQHSVVDILRVSARLAERPGALVLGSRRFAGPVPARSRFGNAATRLAFRAVTGRDVRDTQTGLRGIGPGLIGRVLAVRGDRYEYEMRVLLDAARAGIAINEVDIATIYLDGNASSHFRPVRDSARIYAPLLAFAASSLASSAVDTAMLLVLHLATGSLLGSVVGARLASAAVNFALNRRVVFTHGRDVRLRVAVVRYALLAAGLLAAGYVALAVLTGLGVPLAVAKVTSDLGLFLVSFVVQHRVVFAGRGPHEGSTPAHPHVRWSTCPRAGAARLPAPAPAPAGRRGTPGVREVDSEAPR